MLGIVGVDGVWGWALGLGHGLASLLCFLMFAQRALRNARERERAMALEGQPAKLEASGPCTLRGKVETDDGRPAVEVRIEQTGTEYRVKNGYRHKWSETSRTQDVRPFAVRLDDGTRVAIRAPEDVVLVDQIGTETHSYASRSRIARLVAGESVAVSGVLAKEPISGASGEGYRDGAMGWVLTLPPRALVSADHLSEASARWQRFHSIWAVLGLASLVAFQTLSWGMFYDVALNGVVCDAHVTNLDTYVTRGRRGSRTTHYVVDALLTEGEEVSDEVPRRAYESLAIGDVVPWQIVPGRSSRNQIGALPRMTWTHLMLLLIPSIVLAVAFVIHRRKTTAWWEHPRLIEDYAGRL